MLIHQGITVDGGFSYRLVADFDVEHSIVLTGNGGCLLKPVLKLKSACKIHGRDNDESDEEVLPTTGDNSDDDSHEGFEDPATVGTDPTPVVVPADVSLIM